MTRRPEALTASFGSLADPRLCVLLTGMLGVLVWKAAAPALCCYLAAVLLVFRIGGLSERMEPGSAGRTLRFALFWAALKFLVDASSVVLASYQEAAITAAAFWPEAATASLRALLPALAPFLADAALLFLRLCVLMAAALALTLALSPRSLALAVTWILRPFMGQNAWKPALALALMAQYLPRIHVYRRQTGTAALSRRLPSRGHAFHKLALPQIFRLLAQGTWKQALGIVSRGLDQPEAWRLRVPLPGKGLAVATLTGVAAIALSLL